MKLSLELAQTVIIGRFNKFIVTPGWLAEYDVCTEGTEGDEADADYDEPDDFLDESTFHYGGFEWEVGTNRLGVSSARGGVDCGKVASRVLRFLSHTPVEAVGNNFIFYCTVEQWGLRPSPFLTGKGGGPVPSHSRWVGAFPNRDGASVEIDLTVIPKDLVVLRLNYDRRTANSRQACEASDRFLHDYDDARRLVAELFQIELP